MSSFKGLTDEQWNAIEPHIPFKWGIQHKGNPPLHPRKVLNTILWVLFTGARWKDVPCGEQWASRACADKRLGVWMENGVLERVLKALQDVGVVVKALDLSRLSIDGFFSAGKGGGEEVDYGYKGKGVTTHILVDIYGSPIALTSTGASGDERKQVEPLLNKINSWIKSLTGRAVTPIMEADKGYDSRELRIKTLGRKIFPFISYRGKKPLQMLGCY